MPFFMHKVLVYLQSTGEKPLRIYIKHPSYDKEIYIKTDSTSAFLFVTVLWTRV